MSAAVLAMLYNYFFYFTFCCRFVIVLALGLYLAYKIVKKRKRGLLLEEEEGEDNGFLPGIQIQVCCAFTTGPQFITNFLVCMTNKIYDYDCRVPVTQFAREANYSMLRSSHVSITLPRLTFEF